MTIVTRPRRFGKNLTISTIERFFSTAYKDQAELFDGLDVWRDADMRYVTGTIPVIKADFRRRKGRYLCGCPRFGCDGTVGIVRKFGAVEDGVRIDDTGAEVFCGVRYGGDGRRYSEQSAVFECIPL